MNYARALAVAEEAAREAAVLLREEFHRGPRGMPGHCPADKQAELLIRARLTSAFPDWGYVGEETLPQVWRDHTWLVDPNDGTAAFQEGHRGAAVSIALIHAGLPVLGVVLAHSPPVGPPDLVSWAEGCGPVRRNGVPVIHPLPTVLDGDCTVGVSQDGDDNSVDNAALAAPARFRTIPGIAYRLAMVAIGEVSAGVSLSGPCDYDFAGGHALLRGVGGDLFDLRGEPIRYPAGERSCIGGHADLVATLVSRQWPRALRGGTSTSPLRRPDPKRIVPDARLDRAQGTLLGQLCGDALGSLGEFRSADWIAEHYPEGVRDLRDGGSHGLIAGQPTDDSELALSLARSLLAEGRYDDEDVSAAYVAWAHSGPFDIGNTTRKALHRRQPDAWSTSNGALMRVSPLGIFTHRLALEAAADLARRDARLTHPNAICQDCNAVFVGSIAHAVRTGCSARELYTFALTLPTGPEAREALLAAVDMPLSMFPSRHDGDVRFSFFAAWRQLLHHTDAVDALAEVVAQGRDSDTDAAIAGALFGAVHGALVFPTRWRDRVLTARALPGTPRPRPAIYWPVDALVIAEQLTAPASTTPAPPCSPS